MSISNNESIMCFSRYRGDRERYILYRHAIDSFQARAHGRTRWAIKNRSSFRRFLCSLKILQNLAKKKQNNRIFWNHIIANEIFFFYLKKWIMKQVK